MCLFLPRRREQQCSLDGVVLLGETELLVHKRHHEEIQYIKNFDKMER